MKKRFLKIAVFLIICIAGLKNAFSQYILSDSTNSIIENEVVETFTAKTETSFDFSEAFHDSKIGDELLININKASEEELMKLQLNPLQIANLKTYIKEHGEIASIYELYLVEGFDLTLVKRLQPHIIFIICKELHPLRLQYLPQGRHTFLIREQRVLEKQAGYRSPHHSNQLSDTVDEFNDNSFAGSPDKVLLKYTYNYFDKLRIGITLEKDAGESLERGFDYTSFYVFYKGNGIVKRLVLGNFNAAFGCGLTLQTGFRLSTDPISGAFFNFSNSISSSGSANEGQGLKGAAVTINPLKNTELTFFYSYRKLDGTLVPQTGDTDSIGNSNHLVNMTSAEIGSIIETGLHRTLLERNRKNKIVQAVAGSHVSLRMGIFKIGTTVTATSYDHSIQIEKAPYRLFDFNGKHLCNFGTDIGMTYGPLNAYAEYSGSSNGAKAIIAGVSIYEQEYRFTILYRKYDEDYHNYFSNSYAQGSECRNEQGVYMAFNSSINRQIKLTAGADIFEFPWLKYRVNAPSFGGEYFLRSEWHGLAGLKVIAWYSFIRKMLNSSLNISSDSAFSLSNQPYVINPEIYGRHQGRVEFYCEPLPLLTLHSRLDFVKFKKGSTDNYSNGFMITQDATFRPGKGPVAIHMKYALFDTDDYDTRIYTYENDLLYAWAVPSFSGRGSRFYTMIRYNLNRNLTFWLKYALTAYTDRTLVGSGPEQSNGPCRSELKLQWILKF